MTRRARHAWALASIAAWTLALTPVCPSAAAAQLEPVDLSDLEFAPSLPAGTVPCRARAPPSRIRRSEARPAPASACSSSPSRSRPSRQREGQFSPGLRYSLVSLAKLYQELGDHVAAIATLEKDAADHPGQQRIVVARPSGDGSARDRRASKRWGSASAPRANATSWWISRAEHPTDLRVGAIYAAVADARVAAVERWLADKSEPPIIFGSDPPAETASAAV